MTNAPTLQERFEALAFGTSGLRALIPDLTPQAVGGFVYAFVERLQAQGLARVGQSVAVGVDLRPSSPALAAMVSHALQRLGYETRYLGPVPTPALALDCLGQGCPGIMVTGSHIPSDRNGIKFYTPHGEIEKADEEAMSACRVAATWLQGCDVTHALPPVNRQGLEAYRQRYLAAFDRQALQGLRVGLFQHSAVGRDLTDDLLAELGAEVIVLGRSEDFVPIDTEAVSDEQRRQAKDWCDTYLLDALVSTDGDGDRPLVFDDTGGFIAGDLLGMLAAQSLAITHLAVPLTCNTALERSGAFKKVLRTRVGSPYVLAGMQALASQADDDSANCPRIAGFEANGGFLLASAMAGLDALPTRDALLPIFAVLAQARSQGISVSALRRRLPARWTHSARLSGVPSDQAQVLLSKLASDPDLRASLGQAGGTCLDVDQSDGLRMTYDTGDILHFRQSGNAPELRCYTEASSQRIAQAWCSNSLARAHAELTKIAEAGGSQPLQRPSDRP